MLSVNCMLNQTDYSRDMVSTCSPITTTTRSPMLDITSLLCHDKDDDDLDIASGTTTPSLSGPSSPLSTSSSVSFTSSPSSIHDNLPPFSFTAPSTRLSPPIPKQPSYHHRTHSSHKQDYYTKGTSVSYPPKQPQQQQHSSYHYQHRLLLVVDDDNGYTFGTRSPTVDGDTTDDEDDQTNDKRIKTKRRRANTKQLQVLNRVFQHTFFPSTQMRVQLGRQLGMNPRTVQIWFQNRRQALRTKERQRWLA